MYMQWATFMRSAALGCCMSSIAVQNMGNKSINANQVKEKLLEVLQNIGIILPKLINPNTSLTTKSAVLKEQVHAGDMEFKIWY